MFYNDNEALDYINSTSRMNVDRYLVTSSNFYTLLLYSVHVHHRIHHNTNQFIDVQIPCPIT